MSNTPNDRLLKMMREGGQAQNRAIEEIWKQTEARSWRVVKKGRGTREDVQDTRQEAAVKLYLAIEQDRFRGDTDGALVAFYNQTFLYVWLGKVKNLDKMPQAELDELKASLDPSVEEIMIKLEIQTVAYRQLRDCMGKLDEKCAKIINFRFFDEPTKSWDEVANLLGYGSTQTAQNRGGRCMRSLRMCMGA